ncbi:hypothetical protein Dda3937_04457 [Dickeya dadantii 3937]|uniref:Uncharacterized protein n=1 Tax=Dickeya dadantii (strain 3937) TaxID=198628 RepID=E0SJX9_DICD3|nr:hypothetical protein Dda3937_04457 [Dickeya dadantii 3937]
MSVIFCSLNGVNGYAFSTSSQHRVATPDTQGTAIMMLENAIRLWLAYYLRINYFLSKHKLRVQARRIGDAAFPARYAKARLITRHSSPDDASATIRAVAQTPPTCRHLFPYSRVSRFPPQRSGLLRLYSPASLR